MATETTEQVPAPVATEEPSKYAKGPETIEYNEYPEYKTNLISEAFIKQMVARFNNDEPEKSFSGDWQIFARSKPEPTDNIKYCMAKKSVEGFPTIELMGYAEFEGVTAAACWETMENHAIRMDWDDNMTDFKSLEMLQAGTAGTKSWHEVVYCKMKYPFPLSPRDCVFNKYSQLDRKRGIYFCIWRPCTHPAAPKLRKVTRSWSYGAQFMFQMPGNKMRVWQTGCGTPKGNIPNWLINIAMPKIAVAGIKVLRQRTEVVQNKDPTLAVLPEPTVEMEKEESNGGASKSSEDAAPAIPEAATSEKESE